MDDPELRAIDGTETLRLPHKFIALEFLHADDEDRQDVLTKRIVFARERDEFIYLSGAGCATHDGFWAWMVSRTLASRPKTHCAVPDAQHTMVFRPGSG